MNANSSDIEKLSEIKPCGHCGSIPKVVGIRDEVFYVACLDENCRQPQTCCHNTRQGAIDEWNEETV